jgi:uncharacterized RDD family membrane protein YckC
MRRFFPVAIVCLLIMSASSWAVEHNLLARASVDRTWVAQVTKVDSTDGPAERTDILVQEGADKPWQKLTSVPARAISLASRSSQLVVLFSDGTWQAIWASNGASTGNSLSADGRILTLADDGQSLWAIGSVHGGISAAIAAATTRPATTSPIELPKPVSRPDQPTKLVLFHQLQGRWAPVEELPSGMEVAPGGDISLVIVGDQQLVAFTSVDGSVQILRLSSGGHGWEIVSPVGASSAEPIADFELISAGKGAILWTNSGKGAGSLWPIGPAVGPPVSLSWPDNTAIQAIPVIAAAGPAITLFGVHGGKLYEQRYDPDGKSLGGVAVVSAPVDVRDTNLGHWIDAALMLALGFSVVATLYRRSEQRRNSGEMVEPPPPAPQLPRLGAGLIDMLPVLGVLGYMSFTIDPAHSSMAQVESVQMWIAYFVAVGVYLLHTTLSEVFTGRTIGKFIFGLKTVTIEGTTPHAGQFVIRNLLRVIDLIWFPLTLVLISPLRQRSADVAAGTMVVRNAPQEPAADTPDSP